MSEYADISIRKLSLYWFRNYLDNDIISLFFSERDLFITTGYIQGSKEDESSEYTRYMYKTIAIFDNDAEGYQSKCTLLTEVKKWPDNFRILLYPEIKFFNKYPTLASNGTTITDDINRKACSVELYLPDSIIKEDGKFYPIEWESRKKIKGMTMKRIEMHRLI